MKRSSLAAAAVISAAVLVVPAAPALAAGHGHGPQHGQHHATAHGHAEHAHAHAAKSHGHLARQLRGAQHAVANQLRQVTRLADVVATSDRISDVDRDAVAAALQADVDALTTLQNDLATATSHRDLVSDLHQGILIRAVARTQTTVAEQAGALRAAVATDPTTTDPTTTDPTTTDPTTTDPTTTDPTTTDPTTTDPSTADTVTTDADAAVAAVVELKPLSTREQIHQARQTAEAALADAEAALGSTTGTDDGGDTTSGTTTPTA